MCSFCNKEGHLDKECPQDSLPKLEVLPKMTDNWRNILDKITIQIMGYYLSKMWKRLINKGERDFKIIIVGLHNAGKTTILYKLALNEVVVTQPTIGSNVEEVTHQNVKLQVWDLGGQESLRAAWDAYYENAEAVIYVVDAAESDA